MFLTDRYVLMGNHHDAWTFGGADPNSATAVLMELARAFGDLLSLSKSIICSGEGGCVRKTMYVCTHLYIHSEWRPGRTVMLCSWDSEEYGLIGSYEWLEVWKMKSVFYSVHLFHFTSFLCLRKNLNY